MTHTYRLSAHKLLSDIELPELMPWDGGCESPAELLFRLGNVPARLEKPDHEAGGFATQGRDRYLLAEDDRILIENGSEVTIEPAPGTDLTEARALVMGPVQAVLWHQRGLLPLHASVVGGGGRAVALAGPSGIGKSTLAAALSRKGFSVLADDICIVDTANGAEILPSTPRLRLWRDALDHFGISVNGLPRALSRREKYLSRAARRMERGCINWPLSCCCRGRNVAWSRWSGSMARIPFSNCTRSSICFLQRTRSVSVPASLRR
jgi:hypothetical protein